MSLNFVQTTRGNIKLEISGNFYNKHRLNEKTGTTYWRCEKRPCKASVTTMADNILQHKDIHDHAIIPHELEAKT